MRVRHLGRIGFPLIALLALATANNVDAQGKDKVPLEKLKWHRLLLLDKNDYTGEVDPGKDTKTMVDKQLTARGESAVVPGVRPLVLGNFLVYRTYDDCRVLSLTDDKKPDGLKAGGIDWVSTPGECGLVGLLDRNVAARGTVTNWLNRFPQPDQAQIVLENGLAGAISHDGQRIYWLDNLAVPPQQLPNEKKGKKLPEDQGPTIPEELQALIQHNVLWAMDLKTGKIEWRDGEYLPGKKDAFEKTHFLGVPCPFKDKLYALNETNQGELRLLVLDPANGSSSAAHALDNVQGLQRFMSNPRRQIHAAQITADKDLLICVPHAGRVFGVEAPKFKVRWTYNYGGAPVAPGGGVNQVGFWKDTAPIIHDGKIVFTCADDENVHCVGVDGKQLWKIRVNDGLYLAGVVGDAVLVVANNGCRALSLKDGSDLWRIETGTPSGVGVLDKTTYLLPLKKGAGSKGPEIAYIDAEKGKLIGSSPLSETPGNLTLYQDQVVSVSNTTVMAYRRMQAK
jgi:outer membrane protein assembly factor BamB